MKIIMVGKFVYETMRSLTCKRVYRSGGRNRRKRIKWVKRSA